MVLRDYLGIVTVDVVSGPTDRDAVDLHDMGLDMREYVVTRPELVPVSLQVLLPSSSVY